MRILGRLEAGLPQNRCSPTDQNSTSLRVFAPTSKEVPTVWATDRNPSKSAKATSIKRSILL